MSEDIKNLIFALVSAVVGVGWAALVPFLAKWLTAKMGAANTTQILDWADTFVKMAEKKLGPKTGDLKFDIARSALEGYANSQNIKIDPKSLEAAIEKAVFEMQQPGPAAPAAVGNLVVTEPSTIVSTSPEQLTASAGPVPVAAG